MNKWLRRTLKTVGGIAGGMVVLLGGGALLLNTESVQNKLLKRATELLRTELNTHVEIDSISVNLFTQKVRLFGIDVEDQQQRKMLAVGKLAVDLNLSKLMTTNQVIIEEAEIDGVKALLLKSSKEEPANYQFLIDAFKKDSTMKKDVDKAERKKLNLDVNDVRLRHIDVKYNDMTFQLEEAGYEDSWIGTRKINVEDLQATFTRETKKGPVGNTVSVHHLQMEGESLEEEIALTLDGLRYQTDNHQPRKNANKPKRGFFDLGHLDVTTNMKWTVQLIGKDSLKADLMECQAKDSITGINLTDLRFSMEANKQTAYISHLTVQQTNTVLTIPEATIQLPNKKEGRSLSYSANNITGKALLKDISRTFAPVLKNFNIPLNLSLNLSGTDETMAFRNIKVSTNDQKLQLSASGGITNLKDKYRLAVRFHVNQMTAKSGVKEKIISQFAVKKFMMKQLHNLGNISYTGDFAVLWKKEEFKGSLQTAGGPINFQFALDENTKYVDGSVSTNSFQLGRVMDMKDIGEIVCQADFRFDISKPRTAKMRKEKGGKLPIGHISAKVDDSSYKKIHVRNLSVDMKSDGAVATGDISRRGKHVDLFCSFSFTNTDEMQKMKIISPSVKLHKLSDEDRQKKEQQKLEKQQQKNVDGEKKGFFKRLFSKKKKTETT
ncbi:MAG: hypothetical protein IJV25_00840 [Prevotella sp.]|nr:hypothetical protein [Prevotella sp.]